MKRRDCETIRDLLPDWMEGSLPPDGGQVVQDHLSSCEDCRAELALIEALKDGRPQVPPQLAQRIKARVREELSDLPGSVSEEETEKGTRTLSFPQLRRGVPTWALSAAAVAVLALGVGVIWGPGDPDLVQDPIVVASQEPLPEAWLWDDGMVAGAPVFDGLSDEDLEALLEEFEG